MFVPEFLRGDRATDVEQTTPEIEGVSELWDDTACIITAHMDWGLAVCFSCRAASTELRVHGLLSPSLCVTLGPFLAYSGPQFSHL